MIGGKIHESYMRMRMHMHTRVVRLAVRYIDAFEREDLIPHRVESLLNNLAQGEGGGEECVVRVRSAWCVLRSAWCVVSGEE